jgi:hypothetical protein
MEHIAGLFKTVAISYLKGLLALQNLDSTNQYYHANVSLLCFLWSKLYII